MKFLILVMAFVLANCASLSRMGERKLSAEELAFQEYKVAKLSEEADKSTSCEIYSRLSQLREFPLKKVAMLKSRIYCSSKLEPLNKTEFETEKWLASLLNEALQSEAAKDGSPEVLISFLKEKADRTDRLREKTDLLQRALTLAKKINSPLATEIETQLFKLVPRISMKEDQDFAKQGQEWIASRNFEKGRSFFRKAIASKRTTIEEQYHIRTALRNSFKLEQRREDFLKEAKKLATWSLKTKRLDWQLDTHLALARGLWTEGQASFAEQVLTRIERKLRNKLNLSDLYFVQARMEEENSQFENAIVKIDLGLSQKGNKIAVKNKLLFAKAWDLRKLKRYEEAIAQFSAMKDFAQLESSELQRVKYWLAKSMAQAGRLADAEKSFRELTQDDPLGYYGLIAYRELAEAMPPVTQRESPTPTTRDEILNKLEDKNLIKALVIVEERDLLEAYLGERIFALKQNTSQPEELLFYLRSFAEAGLFHPLFAHLNSLPPFVRSQLVQLYPELLFPRRFSNIINPEAEKRVLQPALVFSIIRQESSFNPKARSPADAFGLMQVLPQVAEKYSREAGVSYASYDDLYDPKINIPIGVSLLSDLNKRYQGQVVLIAAAYNAGEKPLENWLKVRFKEDTVEFIEDIPYEETRGYVKLILRNFIFYQRLEKPTEQIAFPKNCIDGLGGVQVSKSE